MFNKNNQQIDIMTNMIYEKLVPKDHLLVKIDSIIDFSFVYDIVKEKYSENRGRKAYDAVILFKLCLLEYIYCLSDVQVVKRAKTDIVFRWFLGLNLDDEVPDDTTLSHFRIKRLGEEGLQEIFDSIVKKCIEHNLIKTRRFIIDSTHVDANASFPSRRKLICDAFRKVIREVKKFNETLAEQWLNGFEQEIENEYNKSENVPVSIFCEIARKYAESIYLKTYDELQQNNKYNEVFVILWDIIEQYSTGNTKDEIISCVDPDARVAHKSPGNKKRGYKNHILIDEDSELIVAASQTPFNVNDDKELKNLIKKAEETFGLKPEELSADKGYGSTANRAFLKDNGIKSNIKFQNDSNKEPQYFTLDDFEISEDLKSVTCPNKITTYNCKRNYKKANDHYVLTFRFDKKVCDKCPFRDQCFNPNSKSGRQVQIHERYDSILNDKKNMETNAEAFKQAINKRYIIERRFGILVRNHGLRRCRYLRLVGAKIHIILANTACNIVRMVNLIMQQKATLSFATP